MEAIIEKVKELVREKFHDNISYFAKDVGLGREYVSSILMVEQVLIVQNSVMLL